jgi:hypothetical protein
MENTSFKSLVIENPTWENRKWKTIALFIQQTEKESKYYQHTREKIKCKTRNFVESDIRGFEANSGNTDCVIISIKCHSIASFKLVFEYYEMHLSHALSQNLPN